jgi:hypothetical protein
MRWAAMTGDGEAAVSGDELFWSGGNPARLVLSVWI